MKLATIPKTLKFLSDLSRPWDKNSNARVSTATDLKCESGTIYDSYGRDDAKGPVVIALHGMTVNGRRDERLMSFAGALALSGACCFVPELECLSSCRFHRSDLSRLEDVINTAYGMSGRKVLIVGFSFGGGYALSIAGLEGCKKKVGGVISFGAHHSLPELFDLLASTKNIVPRTEDEWDNWIYLKLAFMHGGYLLETYDSWLKEAAFELLKRYCHHATPAEKRSFHDRYLMGVDVQVAAANADRSSLADVSPSGRLGSLECRVGLLHDRGDSLIPSTHTLQNYAELKNQNGNVEMLVTSLLSHVTPATAFKAGELYGMLKILEPFFLTEG